MIEINLCAIDPSQFLVNYREGFLGKELKEGTKTVFPVSYEKAFDTYSNLIKEKRLLGYIEQETPVASPKNTPVEAISKKEYVLERIKQIASGSYSGRWKASRVIWRCGELQITAAADFIVKISTQDLNEFELYSAIFTLCRTGNKNHADTLKTYFQHSDEKIRRLAQAAYISLKQSDNLFLSNIESQLPFPIKDIYKSGKWDDLKNCLIESLKNGKTDLSFIWNLYLLSLKEGKLKDALHEIFNISVIEAGVFKQLRSILKASEMIYDHETWSVISCRLDTAPPLFTNKNNSTHIDNNWLRPADELQKTDSRFAFGHATKKYLSYRALRRFGRLSADNPSQFVELATEYLCAFKTDMGKRSFSKKEWAYDNTVNKYVQITKTYEPFSDAVALNYLLYANSDAHNLQYKKRRWQVTIKEGEAAQTSQRTEAHPDIWDDAPSQIIRLMTQAGLPQVVDFATKVFDANPSFIEKASPEDCAALLYSNKAGLLKTAVAILKYIAKTDKQKLLNTSLISAVCLSVDGELLQWFYQNCPTVAPEQQFEIFEQIAERLNSAPLIDGRNQSYLAAQACLKLFPAVVAGLTSEVFVAITSSEREQVLLFGAKLLAGSPRCSQLAPDVVDRLLNHTSKFVKLAGIELIAFLSEEAIYKHIGDIARYRFSASDELSVMAEQVIESIQNLHISFIEQFSKQLVILLPKPAGNKHWHEGIYKYLKNNSWHFLLQTEPESVWPLLLSDENYAQLLGEELYKELNLRKYLKLNVALELASADSIFIRQEAWGYMKRNQHELQYEAEQSLRLLDAKWDDSRLFAFRFFEEHFDDTIWTPERLIAVCDNIRPDVQSWGRSLMSRYFKHENGKEYLIKLSQHPSANMQLFASNYIESYAGGKTKTILKLKDYFRTVLWSINKGRVCKERVFAFLQNESVRDKQVAEMSAELFSDLSLTIAKGDKARSIALLLDIKKRYPDIEVPLKLNAVQER